MSYDSKEVPSDTLLSPSMALHSSPIKSNDVRLPEPQPGEALVLLTNVPFTPATPFKIHVADGAGRESRSSSRSSTGGRSASSRGGAES